MKKMIIFGLIISIFLMGCSSSNQGKLELSITDAPTDLNLESAMVTISSVEVHMAGKDETSDSSWVEVVGESKTYDLMKLVDAKELLGSTNLSAGKYTQLRLKVDKALVTIDGKEYELEVPSDSLKLVNEFTIEAGKTKKLTLDFDAKESITETGKETYNLRPVIKVLDE